MSLKKYEIYIILALYLTTIYLWTLPIQQGKTPFGDVDAVSHFVIPDYMSSNDKVIVELPEYIGYRYALDNNYKEWRLWYHPTYHVDLGIMQVISGRFIGFYLMVTLLCSLIVVIMYYIIKQMFGFWPGILTALLLMFSGRDYLTFFWGQWPERISYFLTPIILFLFLRYLKIVHDKQENQNYLYLICALVGINLTLHPMGFFHTGAGLFMMYIFFAIKRKRFFLFDLKHLILPVVLFLLIVAAFPDQTGNVIVSFTGGEPVTGSQADYSRLFSWFKPLSDVGVPDEYFSYAKMHGLWTLPLLLLGLIYLLIRRSDQDILMLAWLVSLYVVIHADVFGKGPFVHRSLAASAHVFAPLTAIGLMALISFLISIKSLKPYGALIRYGMIGIFVVLAVTINGGAAYSALNEAGVVTINENQMQATEWMRDNLEDDAHIQNIGTLGLANQRWIQGLSQRHLNEINKGQLEGDIANTHVMFDYSDFKRYGMKEQYDQVIAVEKAGFENSTPIYNQGDIRVYKIEN